MAGIPHWICDYLARLEDLQEIRMRETSLALSIPEVSARDEQAFLPDPPDRLQHRRPARSLSHDLMTFRAAGGFRHLRIYQAEDKEISPMEAGGRHLQWWDFGLK
jgi:hypothetical protein